MMLNEIRRHSHARALVKPCRIHAAAPDATINATPASWLQERW